MAIASLPDPDVFDALTATRPPLRLLSLLDDGGRAADQVVTTIRPIGGPTAAPKRWHPASWRRRGTILVLAGLLAALALPIGAIAGTSGASDGALVPGATYVVRPGDTLWSIATRLEPGRDPASFVARMAAETGSRAVVPGEHLVLP